MSSAVPGVDLDAVGEWLDGRDVPRGRLEHAERIGGGTQNVMVRFTRGGHRFVLRRPPEHPRPHSDDALRRELRVLAGLAGTPIPVPRVVAADPDAAVLGVVSYVMEHVDGFSPEGELPARYRDDAGARREIGLQIARVAARLGEVDPASVGLGDLGRPDGFLARQVPRWRRELASYDELPGYPGGQLPAVDEVGDWIERHRPAAGAPGLLHGDLHLANVLYHRDEPRLVAVVDWEMATVADPLLDLGWLLATGPGPDGEGIVAETPVGRAGGLPDRAEVVAAYAEHSSRSLDAVTWYEVLACFKLGILLEGTHARACAGRASPEVGARLHRHARILLARAHRLAE